jgi:ATP-dependent DNA helicase RecQ
LPAECLLLYRRADAVRLRHFIAQGAPTERSGRQARLAAMLRYAETSGCRRRLLLAYLGDAEGSGGGAPHIACTGCDNCHPADPFLGQVVQPATATGRPNPVALCHRPPSRHPRSQRAHCDVRNT